MFIYLIIQSKLKNGMIRFCKPVRTNRILESNKKDSWNCPSLVNLLLKDVRVFHVDQAVIFLFRCHTLTNEILLLKNKRASGLRTSRQIAWNDSLRERKLLHTRRWQRKKEKRIEKYIEREKRRNDCRDVWTRTALVGSHNVVARASESVGERRDGNATTPNSHDRERVYVCAC